MAAFPELNTSLFINVSGMLSIWFRLLPHSLVCLCMLDVLRQAALNSTVH